MALDKVDTGLLWASAILSGGFSANVDNVFKAVLNGIDWVTNEISSTSAWTALDALGIETLWALWTGWLSVLLTYLMSSKDEKANAIIRSLIIWWVITTSWPMLMAALTGFIWKKIWDMPWQETRAKA